MQRPVISLELAGPAAENHGRQERNPPAMAMDRARLTTEQRNPRTRDLDRRSALAIVDLLNAEDRRVAPAVAKAVAKAAHESGVAHHEHKPGFKISP